MDHMKVLVRPGDTIHNEFALRTIQGLCSFFG